MTLKVLYINAEKTTPDGWIVSISHNGQVLRSGILLKDPLSPEQREICRWYLEDFVQKSPFSSDKALAAEDMLLKYPRTVIKNLGLDAVIFSLQTWDRRDTGLTVFHIIISQNLESVDNDGVHRLLWETLEAPAMWNSRLQVIVRRSFTDSKDCDQSHGWPVSSPPDHIDLTAPTINLLVVVARDLRRSAPSQYQDVSPKLATEVLLRMKDILAQDATPVNLNIEVARPGTFLALKSHLKQREEQNGPGYFQAIHFDLHGKIGDRAGKGGKTGMLYFAKTWDTVINSSAEDKDIAAVATVSVARLVARYKIPLVLLNACESASAVCGSEANMAQQFLKRGAQNVIGMSFKISDRAVAVFLHHFYRALFVDGFSVSMSAGVGRMAQRAILERPARYGLERKLRDGSVPILYGNCDKVFRSAPGMSTETAAEKYFTVLHALAPDEETTVMPHSCFGREFDLLRLERLQGCNPITYLHGLAGVGKSTFLRFAMGRWKKTRLRDVYVMVDFTGNPSMSRRDVLSEITRQLKSQRDLKELDTIHQTQSQEKDGQKAEATILNVFRTIKATIVVDGMDNLLSDPTVPFPISLGALSDALPLIRELIGIATDTSLRSTCHVILAQRRASTPTDESLLGCKIRPYTYELLPLDLPEAIDFSGQVAKASRHDMSDLKLDDLDWLESTVELLQRIPGTLVTVLPLRKQGETWESFYMRLHSGLFSSMDEVKAALSPECTAVVDIKALWRLGPLELLLYSEFGLYWTISPSVGGSFSIFRALNPEMYRQFEQGNELRIAFFVFALVVFEHGYINYHGNVSSIHPMFTIIATALVREHITFANRVTVARELAASLEGIAYRPATSVTWDWAPNYHTIMRSCIKELPVERWPLAFMVSCCTNGATHVPAAMKAMLDDTHCELLTALRYKLNLLEDQTMHLYFFSLTLLNISFRCIGKEPAKQEQILALAESGYERICGLPLEEHTRKIRIFKGLFLTTASLMLLELGGSGSLNEKVEDLRCLLPSLGVSNLSTVPEIPDSTGAETVANKAAILFAESSLDADDDDTVVEFLRIVSMNLDECVIKVEERPRSSKAMQLQSHLESILPDADCKMDSPEDIFISLYLMQMALLIDPSQDAQFEPVEMHSMAEALDNIDNVHDVEDWFEACSQHALIATDLISQNQIQSAIAHLQSVETVLNKVDVPQSLKAAVKSCRGRMLSVWWKFKGREVLFPNSMLKITFASVSLASSTPSRCVCSDELERHAFSTCAADEFFEETRDSSASHHSPSTDGIKFFLDYLRKHNTPAADLFSRGLKISAHMPADGALALFQKLMDELKPFSVHFPLQGQLFLQRIKHLTAAMSEYRELLLKAYLIAVLDRGVAASFVQETVPLLAHFNDSQTKVISKQMNLMLTKHEFVIFRVSVMCILKLESPTPKEDVRKIFTHIMQKFRDGRFLELADHIEFSDTCIQVASWLITDAAESRQWRTVLEYCQLYEAQAPLSHRDDPDTKARIFHYQQQAEFALVNASLDEAEATLDFAGCFAGLDRLQELRGISKSLPGIARVSVHMYGDKFFRGLTEAYERRCLACARWVRRLGDARLLPEDGRLRRIYSRVIWLLQKCSTRGSRRPLACRRRLTGRPKHRHDKSRLRRQALLRKRLRARLALQVRAGESRWRERGGHQCGLMKRTLFSRPAFGCPHHCEGEYCFF